MSICHFASLCISDILRSIGKCEVLLELAQLGHSGFGQKPNQNPIGQCWLYGDIFGIKSIYLSLGIQWWSQISHLNQTKRKPQTQQSLKLANLAILGPGVIG